MHRRVFLGFCHGLMGSAGCWIDEESISFNKISDRIMMIDASFYAS